MLDPQDSLFNRIPDALVAYISRSRTDHPEAWAIPPETIERGISPAMVDEANTPTPCIYISSSGDFDAVEQRALGSIRFKQVITIGFFLRNTNDIERDTMRFMDNLFRVLMLNRQLQNVEDPAAAGGPLTTGMLSILRGEIRITLDPPATGAVRFDLGAQFQWTPTPFATG
jgi:hypothetical protein